MLSARARALLKRYFRVAAKPIMLALLYYITVIWLCFFFWFTLPYDPQSMFLDPRWRPEIRFHELERVENFGSFLNSILQWNFGRSFSETAQPIMVELPWRINNTLILIGFSTAGSILAGAVISLIAFIRKPNKRRPLTFAHSLKCFLFGLTPVIALVLIDIFCLHLRWFPRSGLVSLPPPSPGSANYYMDVLKHLFIPVLTLTLVNAIRSAMIIWSSSSSLDSKSPWKIFLLPITTIDFTFMVTAAVFAECIFGLPGVGDRLISSLFNNDHNFTIASFVALLAITVGLGLVSAFLDLLQVGTGIREDLEKPSSRRSEIEPQPNKRSQTKNKLANYLKRKSLVIGLIIVSFFIVLGIAAPLLTPYLPKSLYYSPRRVAGSFAMPGWMTIFPQFQDLPPTQITPFFENMTLVGNLTDSVTINEVERTITFNSSMKEEVTVLLHLFTIDYQYQAPSFWKTDYWHTAELVRAARYSMRLILTTEENNTNWNTYLKDPTKAPIYTSSYKSPPVIRGVPQVITNQTRHNLAYSGFASVIRGLFAWKYPDDPQAWCTLNPAKILMSQKGVYHVHLLLTFDNLEGFIPSAPDSVCKIRLDEGELFIPGEIWGVLGTDGRGNDVWTELVYSARTTVVTSFSIAALAVILGLPFGFLAGRFKGWTDNIVMVAAETFLFLPIVPLLLICIRFSRSSSEWLPVLFWVLPAIAIIGFRNVYLTSPTENKSKRSQIFALFRYSLSNFCLTAISISLILISMESLGFGDPNLVSWGRMLLDAQITGGLVARAWWTYISPIGCILLFTTGLFLIGSSLDEA